MADEGARLGDSPSPAALSRSRIALLTDLREEGLRLVSEGDIAAREAWHRRWMVLLDEIETQLRLEAPRQAEMVLWPDVDSALPDTRFREELVRAAVGCRELSLLVGELTDHREKGAEIHEGTVSSDEARQGAIYVRAGRRFEGAVRLRRLIEPAQESLVIVDRYVDDGTFTLAAAAATRISRRFLTLNYREVKRAVSDAWANWAPRWEGDTECRTGIELPHMRLLVVDGAPYHIDSSLKDFGSNLTCFRKLLTEEWEIIQGDVESTWRGATPL